MSLSHFTAALVFSLCVSVVFGITQRAQPRRMFLYGAKCFAYFIGGLLAASWAMWLLKR
jgi:energy-converting hydrogenase Eha subunit A